MQDYRGSSNLPELHGLLTRELMIRRRKEEVLTQLPSKRRTTVLLRPQDTLPATERKQLEQLHAELRSLDPHASDRLESLTKLGEAWRATGLAKLVGAKAYLADVLAGSDGKKVVVATVHHHCSDT